MTMRSEIKYLVFIILLSIGLSSTILTLLGMTYFIPQFLAYSLSDSINPCTFVVYTFFLIALSVKGLTRKQLYLVGLFFILAVYISYYLIGIGLSLVVGRIPKEWSGYMAVIFGTYTMITGVLERSRTLGKGRLRKFAFSTRATILGAITLGFLVSTTLLPCSMGPYLVYESVVAHLTRALVLLLLALYNLVFVLPLFVILFATGSLRESKEFSRTMVRHSRELSVLSGFLLMTVGAWLLLSGS